MRKQTSFFLAIIIALFVSCQKELERPDRAYPLVSTNGPINITGEGFDIDLIIEGQLDQITSYGFVWNEDSGIIPDINDLSVTFQGGPSEITSFTNISRDLPIGAIRVRAFIRTADLIIYSATQSVASLGGLAPTINQITPSSISPGDTICISGEGFASLPSGNQVFFDQTEVELLSSSDSQIKVIAPITNNSSPDISVRSWGKTTTASTSVMSNVPSITGTNHASQSIDQQITIYGTNFSVNNSANIVRFESSGVSSTATVLESYTDSLIVNIPDLSHPSITNFDISVSIGSLVASKENCFEFLRPMFDSQQSIVSLCDTIIIKGSNFSPTPDNNSIFTILDSGSSSRIPIISSSTTEVKFVLNSSMFIESGKDNGGGLDFFSIVQTQNDYQINTELPIVAPTFSDIAPSTVSSISDRFVEITGMNFNPFLSHYSTSSNLRLTDGTEIGKISSVSCDKIVIEITDEYFTSNETFNEIWNVSIPFGGGCITPEIAISIEGPIQALNQAPQNMLDLFTTNQAFSYNGKGYFLDLTGNVVRAYEPASDTWTTVANGPTGAPQFSFIQNQVVGNQAIHSWIDGSEIKVAALDLDNNTWTAFPAPTSGLTPSLSGHIDFVHNDKYYIISSEVWEYDLITFNWTQKANVPVEYFIDTDNSATTIDNSVFIVSEGNLLIYDVITDTWSTSPSLMNSSTITNSGVSFEQSTINIDGKLYLITANVQNTGTIIAEYDPVTDSWSDFLTFNTRLFESLKFLFALDGKAFMYNYQNTEISAFFSQTDFWAYTPE